MFHVHEVTDGGVGWRYLLHDKQRYSRWKPNVLVSRYGAKDSSKIDLSISRHFEKLSTL